MSLYKYLVDGSSLSFNEREKLLQLLDDYAYTGTIYVDIKKGLYQAMFEDTIDISTIPFPPGTILNRIYP
jgi:hypothetical protein